MTERNAIESFLHFPREVGHTMPHRVSGKTPGFGKEADRGRRWGKV